MKRDAESPANEIPMGFNVHAKRPGRVGKLASIRKLSGARRSVEAEGSRGKSLGRDSDSPVGTQVRHMSQESAKRAPVNILLPGAQQDSARIRLSGAGRSRDSHSLEQKRSPGKKNRFTFVPKGRQKQRSESPPRFGTMQA
jgi:hypothetical protein